MKLVDTYPETMAFKMMCLLLSASVRHFTVFSSGRVLSMISIRLGINRYIKP